MFGVAGPQQESLLFCAAGAGPQPASSVLRDRQTDSNTLRLYTAKLALFYRQIHFGPYYSISLGI